MTNLAIMTGLKIARWRQQRGSIGALTRHKGSKVTHEHQVNVALIAPSSSLIL